MAKHLARNFPDMGRSRRRDRWMHARPPKHRLRVELRDASSPLVYPSGSKADEALRAEYRELGIDPALVEVLREKKAELEAADLIPFATVRPPRLRVRRVREPGAASWIMPVYEVSGPGFVGLPQTFTTWAAAMRFADRLVHADRIAAGFDDDADDVMPAPHAPIAAVR